MGNTENKQYDVRSEDSQFVDGSFIPDPENRLNNYVLRQMWIYFKMNNQVYLNGFPPNTLKLEIAPNDITDYFRFLYGFVEPMFLLLLGGKEYGRTLTFYSNYKNETTITFLKTDNEFFLLYSDMGEKLYRVFLDAFTKNSGKTNYYGHSYLAEVYNRNVSEEENQMLRKKIK